MLVKFLSERQVREKDGILVFHSYQFLDQVISSFGIGQFGSLFTLEIINNKQRYLLSLLLLFDPDPRHITQQNLLILILKLDIFLPKINITLTIQQPIPKKLLDKIVIVLDDNLRQDVDRFNHFLLKDHRCQDSLDDQFFEK
jgi:hypothetical protein